MEIHNFGEMILLHLNNIVVIIEKITLTGGLKVLITEGIRYLL